jgi:ATP-dependent Clp protease ATP-binding subunit ClpA
MVNGILIAETELLELAREEVRRFRQKYIRCEHLLLALARLDSSLDLDYEALSAQIAKLPYPTCGAEEKLELANGAQRALDAARKQTSGDKLDSQVVLQNILRYSPLARRIFDDIAGK